MTEPRLLTRQTLRAYLGGLPWSTVQQLIAERRLPQPLWKKDTADETARWDRKAVDQALDAASGVVMTVEEQTAMLDRAMGFRS
jgi:hypothetical protein